MVRRFFATLFAPALALASCGRAFTEAPVAAARLCGAGVLALGLALALLVAPAFAQDTAAPASTIFDFGPFASSVIEFLAPALLSLVGLIGAFVLTRVSSWLRLRIDDEQRAAVEQALQRAVGFAIESVGDKARGGIPINLKTRALHAAVGYAERSIPDALAHFKVTPQRLQEMVEARLEGLTFDPAVPETEMAISPVQMRLSRA